MSADAHPLRTGVLRALQVAARNNAELARCMSAHPTSLIVRTVEALLADGLIAFKWGRYRLTRRGRQALPSLSSLPPMVPYRSPTVVRRPGSEVAAQLPSVAGGRLIRRDA